MYYEKSAWEIELEEVANNNRQNTVAFRFNADKDFIKVPALIENLPNYHNGHIDLDTDYYHDGGTWDGSLREIVIQLDSGDAVAVGWDADGAYSVDGSVLSFFGEEFDTAEQQEAILNLFVDFIASVVRRRLTDKKAVNWLAKSYMQQIKIMD